MVFRALDVCSPHSAVWLDLANAVFSGVLYRGVEGSSAETALQSQTGEFLPSLIFLGLLFQYFSQNVQLNYRALALAQTAEALTCCFKA